MSEEEVQEDKLQEEQEEDGLRPVASSMVAEIGFDPESDELTVVFNNGHENTYPITPEQWKELQTAPSIGQWMWSNVL